MVNVYSIIFLLSSLIYSSDSLAWTKYSVDVPFLLKHRSFEIHRSDVSGIDNVNDTIYILSSNGPRLESRVTDKVDIIPFLKPDIPVEIFKIRKSKIISTIKLRSSKGFFVGVPLNNSIDFKLRDGFRPIAVTEENSILPSNKMGVLPIDFVVLKGMYFLLDGYGPRLMIFSKEGKLLKEKYLNSDDYKFTKGIEVTCHPLSIKRNGKNKIYVINKCTDGSVNSLLISDDLKFITREKLHVKLKESDYMARCANKIIISSSKKENFSILRVKDGKPIVTLKGRNISFGCNNEKVNSMLERNLVIKCNNNNCFSNKKIHFWQN